MRKLRSDNENLRDTRIAYTFLISLTVLCLVLGLMATHFSTKLHKNELDGCRGALTLCSDALREWELAQSPEERYAAALRFENAASALPSQVDVTPLLSMSKQMRQGKNVNIHPFSDTFSLLAALDYTNSDEAASIIAKAIQNVSLAVPENLPKEESESVSAPLPEVIAYSEKVAKRGIAAMFGTNAGALIPALSETGDVFTAESENLRMTFSAADGCLDSFVYIRLGNTPKNALSDTERLAEALAFFNLSRHRSSKADISTVGSSCGFLIADITSGNDIYRTAVDVYGRVWSIAKVKR